jgi:hypothetical protein
MKTLNEISKRDLIELLESLVDGIDGIESEAGTQEVARYWDVASVERARLIIDAVKAAPAAG